MNCASTAPRFCSLRRRCAALQACVSIMIVGTMQQEMPIAVSSSYLTRFDFVCLHRPACNKKKTKSKHYETLKAFQPTSMKAWEAIVTTPLNFLECSFSVDGIAVIFRGGEDENSQNNRNAANCVLLTACTASYDSRYAASVVDILQHPSDLPTCIRSSNSRRSHKLRTSHTQDDDASPLLERGIVHPLHLGSALFGADVPLFKHACPSRLWIPCSSS